MTSKRTWDKKNIGFIDGKMWDKFILGLNSSNTNGCLLNTLLLESGAIAEVGLGRLLELEIREEWSMGVLCEPDRTSELLSSLYLRLLT